MSGRKSKSKEPFLLRPSGKGYLWGGSRINDEFGKNINLKPLAETWECSTHPNGMSYVASGKLEGKSLADVVRDDPELLGNRMKAGSSFPFLIKFIDADQDLSIQVHPTDDYARQYENGQHGKIEMWYVLDASEGAKLVYGLNRTMTSEGLKASIENGTVSNYLQKISVKKDDVFVIKPGTIHAIGEGILIVEIQENSDLTYRLYDYDRLDKNNKRELHIDKAIEVAELNQTANPRQPMRVLKYKPGMASELLGRCKYFEVHRLIVNTERRQKIYFSSDELSFRVLLCINGCGIMSFGSETLDIYKGDCFFVPADSVDIRLHGKMQFLDVRG